MEVGPVIQEQPGHALLVLLHGELAHGKIALHQILPAGDGEAVELGVLRAPGFKVRHRDEGREQVALTVKLGISQLISHNLRRDFHSGAVEIRDNEKILDVRLRHGFHPHGLPDAALGRIPDAAPLGALFAPGEAAFLRIISNTDNDVRSAVFDQVGDIQGKGQIAAHMAAGLPVIDPDGGRLVHGAEMEQQPLAAELGRNQHLPVIPETFPAFQTAAYAGQLRLRGEGHKDAALIFRRLPGAGSDGIVPGAVQIHPVGPGHLRPGIFRQGLIPIDLIRPGCFHLRTGRPCRPAAWSWPCRSPRRPPSARR